MRDLLRRLFGVIRKEIVELVRQPGLLAILVVGPLAILLLFGSGVRATDPAVPTIFVAPPDNPDVQELVEGYADSQDERLTIVDVTTDAASAEERLRDGEVDVVVEVPDITAEGLVEQEERAVVRVRHRFLDPLEAQAINLFTQTAVDDINVLLVATAIESTQGVAREVLGDVSDEDVARAAEAAGVEAPDDADQAQVRAEVEALLNRDPDVLASPLEGDSEPLGGAVSTSAFYAPAVVALILQHLTITFIALSVSRERIQRTTELMAVSPLRPIERVLGKVVAYLLIGLVLGAAMLLAVVTLLGAPIRAGVAPVAIVLALELAASIGIGFLLAGIARSTTQVVQGAMLLLLLSVFFGNLLLSPQRLLDWAQPIGWALPMTHAINLLRDSMLRGNDLATTPLAVLGAVAAGTIAVGAWMSTRGDRAT
ncbi:ABC transporter permease [Euzebya sp.]|uniref:ABC transporter permease n=1 Tax=Euzebya sp. TaxID=1971409 RepID=UPI003519C923